MATQTLSGPSQSTTGTPAAGADSATVGMTGMQKMARRMWAPMLFMGFMIVAAALVIGVINAGTTADYFSADKAARDTAVAGDRLVDAKVSIEGIKAWLPGLKFFGMGLILAGITFLLATILGTLRQLGYKVQTALGRDVKYPTPPGEARLFPIFMMMGLMLLMVTFVVAIVVSQQAGGYWNHSIATELDPAAAGSALLSTLGTIRAEAAWLAPLKFFGLALILTGIALALGAIIKVLRAQAQMIVGFLSNN
jgi:hypothetical protein